MRVISKADEHALILLKISLSGTNFIHKNRLHGIISRCYKIERV